MEKQNDLPMYPCPHCGHCLTGNEVKHLHRIYCGKQTSEKKLSAQRENARKLGGRPKGCKNKAPRIDKGVKRK